MVYESSYESGRRPFRPDTTRGYWSSPTDFIYICMGLAFKLDIFAISWLILFNMGVASIIPYLMVLGIYVVPMMVIQSFMGQFSSSGFISAFRVTPLFKGIGYISLALNFTVLTYYSLFAAVPLLYLFNSFLPTLPWSCEGFKKWGHKFEDDNHILYCNATGEEAATESPDNSTDYRTYQVPSILFFRSHFNDFRFMLLDTVKFDISWSMVGCTLFAWGIVALVFYKFSSTQKIGKLLRFSVWGTSVVLLICLTRFMFLTKSSLGLIDYFQANIEDMHYGIGCIPLFTMAAFGSGWGTIVSLSSFNKFKTNIMSYSWIICLGQMFIFLAFGMTSFFLVRHLLELTENNNLYFIEHHWIIFLSSGSALAHLELPNMWSILYYGMLSMAALIIIVIQLFSLLISIFDEFEALRSRKTEVTMTLIGVLAIFSLYFCTSHGVVFFSALSMDSLFTQTAINLFLILVVLWIYGRERFQRDIEFMISQRFSTWKVNMLRFVTPLGLILILLFTIVLALYEHFFSSVVILIFAIFSIVLPWLFIPGYAIFIMLQTTGPCKMRFKRSCRPTDWYPVESEDRQRYEEYIGNMDITHQLNEVNEEVL